jgi:SAM-dependent methyltransferase
MATVVSHYETHLAPIYAWMAGGVEHAVALGANDVAEFLPGPGYAIDLGAGFGMHAIPLARSGYRVLAVDTSEHLLAQLRQQWPGPEVETVVADLLDFTPHIRQKAHLVLCMGDTLTHLQAEEQVATLMHRVSDALRPGGHFIATFRDYRRLPSDTHRFIPVRSDAQRILTCFVEEAGEHALVHDVLHERKDDNWTMKVSSYRKLRLSPEVVVDAAHAAGLNCQIQQGPRGMVTLRAVAL